MSTYEPTPDDIRFLTQCDRLQELTGVKFWYSHISGVSISAWDLIRLIEVIEAAP